MLLPSPEVTAEQIKDFYKARISAADKMAKEIINRGGTTFSGADFFEAIWALPQDYDPEAEKLALERPPFAPWAESIHELSEARKELSGSLWHCTERLFRLKSGHTGTAIDKAIEISDFFYKPSPHGVPGLGVTYTLRRGEVLGSADGSKPLPGYIGTVTLAAMQIQLSTDTSKVVVESVAIPVIENLSRASGELARFSHTGQPQPILRGPVGIGLEALLKQEMEGWKRNLLGYASPSQAQVQQIAALSLAHAKLVNNDFWTPTGN